MLAKVHAPVADDDFGIYQSATFWAKRSGRAKEDIIAQIHAVTPQAKGDSSTFPGILHHGRPPIRQVTNRKMKNASPRTQENAMRPPVKASVPTTTRPIPRWLGSYRVRKNMMPVLMSPRN